jgi:FkbM family methyltransferase
MEIVKNSVTFNVDPIVVHNPNFWEMVTSDSWEPSTFKILQRCLSKDHTYLDIGAWVGPTVLFGSQLAKSCYAFEPDPVAYDALVKNLKLNPNISNVTTIRGAVGAHTGTAQLGTNIGHGDSMSSFLWSKDSMTVDSISLADVLQKYNITDCNFIKMDIEGGEAAVLPAAKEVLKELKATLYLSLHTPWFNDKVDFFDKINDVLSIYKNVYDSDWKKISPKEVTQLKGFSAVIATND